MNRSLLFSIIRYFFIVYSVIVVALVVVVVFVVVVFVLIIGQEKYVLDIRVPACELHETKFTVFHHQVVFVFVAEIVVVLVFVKLRTIFLACLTNFFFFIQNYQISILTREYKNKS
jgi:hypothetical protein